MTRPDKDRAAKHVQFLGSLMVPAQPQFLARDHEYKLRFGVFKNSFYPFWMKRSIQSKIEDPSPPRILASHALLGDWSDREIVERWGSAELVAVRLSSLWHVLHRFKLDTAVARGLFPKEYRWFVALVFDEHGSLYRVTFTRKGNKWKFVEATDTMAGTQESMGRKDLILIAPKHDSGRRRTRGVPGDRVVQFT